MLKNRMDSTSMLFFTNAPFCVVCSASF